MKARSARENLEDFVTSFDNPEIAAMAAICRILEELPDDAARLRVMRWAFSRFSEEFKRPVPEAPAAPPPVESALAPVTAAASATPAPPRPVLVTSPPLAADTPPSEPADFDQQVAELNDLFGDRPDGLKLAKPRER